MQQVTKIALLWKLRRVAADLRQQDVAIAVGISTTRYSAIEHGETLPSDLETRLIEHCLPPLPIFCVSEKVEEDVGQLKVC